MRNRSGILLLCNSLLGILWANSCKSWQHAPGAVSARMEVAAMARPVARASQTTRSLKGIIDRVEYEQASTGMPGPQVGGLAGEPSHEGVGAAGVGFLESRGAKGQRLKTA